MTRKILLAWFFSALCALALSCAAAFAALAAREADAFIVADAEGTGTSEEQALADARRRAVQQAIGFLSQGLTRTQDGQTEENIVRLSRAFIEKYEVTAKREEKGRHTVSIRAWIRKENLLAGLLQKDPSRSVLDGVSLVTRAATREQQVQEAGDILVDVFRSMPLSNFIRCSTEGTSFQSGSEKLKLGIHFTFDRELFFSQAVPQLVSVLDYVSESSAKDVPFLFPLSGGDPVSITPPVSVDSLPRYRELMDLRDGNFYIDLPDGGGFANIYVLTRNYYFNAYRVAPEAFSRLAESLFRPDRQGMLDGRSLGRTDLKMEFKGGGGAVLFTHTEPLQLHNVLFFMDIAALKKTPWSVRKHGPVDERRHALFVLPAFGTLQGGDYLLIQADEAELELPVPTDVLKAVQKVDSSIVSGSQAP
ncbi:hypothetical protein [Fretibacterium fastidiosum]|uniref:Uncharacterized protein n=1 Tax=Fretibacterium fastidiosum TaxID=651822 RepID=A0AB94IXP2_9BACT|nr:hypothetical protein [Fretibacterium fastidiosum]CBL28552.1 hypothetical protein SY1_15420 [Fretibacterium fastidiosum]